MREHLKATGRCYVDSSICRVTHCIARKQGDFHGKRDVLSSENVKSCPSVGRTQLCKLQEAGVQMRIILTSPSAPQNVSLILWVLSKYLITG